LIRRGEERRPIHHSVAWYFRHDTRPHGPHTLEEMRRFVAAKRVGPETLVWSERVVGDWTPAEAVPVLAGDAIT
jgi:hypothetical protein